MFPLTQGHNFYTPFPLIPILLLIASTTSPVTSNNPEIFFNSKPKYLQDKYCVESQSTCRIFCSFYTSDICQPPHHFFIHINYPAGIWWFFQLLSAKHATCCQPFAEWVDEDDTEKSKSIIEPPKSKSKSALSVKAERFGKLEPPIHVKFPGTGVPNAGAPLFSTLTEPRPVPSLKTDPPPKWTGRVKKKMEPIVNGTVQAGRVVSKFTHATSWQVKKYSKKGYDKTLKPLEPMVKQTAVDAYNGTIHGAKTFGNWTIKQAKEFPDNSVKAWNFAKVESVKKAQESKKMAVDFGGRTVNATKDAYHWTHRTAHYIHGNSSYWINKFKGEPSCIYFDEKEIVPGKDYCKDRLEYRKRGYLLFVETTVVTITLTKCCKLYSTDLIYEVEPVITIPKESMPEKPGVFYRTSLKNYAVWTGTKKCTKIEKKVLTIWESRANDLDWVLGNLLKSEDPNIRINVTNARLYDKEIPPPVAGQLRVWQMLKILSTFEVDANVLDSQENYDMWVIFQGHPNHMGPVEGFLKEEDVYKNVMKVLILGISHLGISYPGLRRSVIDYIFSTGGKTKIRLHAMDVTDKTAREAIELLQLHSHGVDLMPDQETKIETELNRCKVKDYQNNINSTSAKMYIDEILKYRLLEEEHVAAALKAMRELVFTTEAGKYIKTAGLVDKAFPQLHELDYSISDVIAKIDIDPRFATEENDKAAGKRLASVLKDIDKHEYPLASDIKFPVRLVYWWTGGSFTLPPHKLFFRKVIHEAMSKIYQNDWTLKQVGKFDAKKLRDYITDEVEKYSIKHLYVIGEIE